MVLEVVKPLSQVEDKARTMDCEREPVDIDAFQMKR